ncbi:translational GTPase TypA [candidate division WWE3 bacterium CG09_land_8_20_14_0_10_39_24]|uniref:50S ribosomal subunit assembly factor BipA n=2 Tax=Katanobacteria TaxID=422282 RepID=A0A2G9XC42_UNCKA|nr:MAG: GTP-binding protein TypA [bacterium CG2_30_40_12]OJI08182.1 MAG: GTP-binding protein TypA [bacterium CG09_39_24]PIP04558.1 MAG: translational GTPase TypA [candidate division WWE3 bacterium CG23_combo_of_CG06-09_8_20_14_all_40_14]PIS12623.1 MAG: translational GTPase TypA [candidate division WWE3 bacterium CG09_land_8_20_14_0_10_39_24]
MDIRNVAIIAHVDHGKTTLVDGLLKQSKTFRENEAEMSQTLILDSNDQEKERGITILAKNTAIIYKNTKINIIDTPGHADFSGEVERTLNMADGAILVIDAQEGPMPQTKFVLKKAFELGLRLIVVINKIDKKYANIPKALNKTYDLFLDLAQADNQLNFPVFYAIGREGKAWEKIPTDFSGDADLTAIFEAILKYIPAPAACSNSPFQMLVASLDWDAFKGKYSIGKITRGTAKRGLKTALIGSEGIEEISKIDHIYANLGLKRVEIEEGFAGDIVAITGIKNSGIGDTIADFNNPEGLPRMAIEEPTLKLSVSANTSPFAGREGKFCTSRQLLERIKKELDTNVSLKLEMGAQGEFTLFGRGELHLSVFIENLRREGYEFQVSRPQVVIREINGVNTEPVEELTVDTVSEYAQAITSEVIQRRGILVSQSANSDGSARIVFEITTRGLIGLKSAILTLSKGTAAANSYFIKNQPLGTNFPKLRKGVLIASEAGKALTYGLNVAQGRGITFINPGTPVYPGMIIGLNSREDDIEINVCKEKKQTNVRSSTADIAVILTPPTIMSLEQNMEFLERDELLEVTPKNLRLRKKILDPIKRRRSKNIIYV